MGDFVLVDLGSQAQAFRRYIEGWEPDDVLVWLVRHGKVMTFPDFYDGRTFLFRSVVGIETGFFFKDGKLILIGDHTTY